MSDVKNEAASAVYGDSWGNFFGGIDEPADTPDTEPDDVADEDNQGNETQLEPIEDDEDDTETEGEEPDAEPEPEVEEDPEIDMGEGKKPVKMSELKKGFMRQSDYTKKTQELADQRKELDGQRESLQAVQGFKDHMDANPWLWGQINQAIKEFNETGVLPLEDVLQDAQSGKYINHLLAENTQLKQKLDSLSGEYEGVKLSSAMQSMKNELSAEYGDLVTDEYMNKLQERAKTEKLSNETLREIADGYLAKQSLSTNKKDVKKATKKAEAQAIQKLAETKRTAPSSAKNTGAVPSKEKMDLKLGASWGDFFKSITD